MAEPVSWEDDEIFESQEDYVSYIYGDGFINK